MMARMSDWNFMTVIIVVGVFALWKLELAATLLNLKAFPAAIPPELADLMGPDKLQQARDYLRVNARFGILQSSFSLTVLLLFWALGGFGWLDGVARSWAASELVAGLVFISLLILGQSLLGLPFAAYDTFVIEESFGFNRAHAAHLHPRPSQGPAAGRTARPAAAGCRVVDFRSRRPRLAVGLGAGHRFPARPHLPRAVMDHAAV
jgi:hypothetical protein